MLLILSDDVELNPGQIRYPCGTCAKPVRSNRNAIGCDTCHQWIHKKCINMRTIIYENLGNILWHCDRCRLSSFRYFFQRMLTTNTNSFSCLSNDSLPDDQSQTIDQSPQTQSSPHSKQKTGQKLLRPIKLLSLNMRSVNNEKAVFLNLLDSERPDVVMMRKTWLKPLICSSEILPPEFIAYMKDCMHGYRGVMIAV